MLRRSLRSRTLASCLRIAASLALASTVTTTRAAAQQPDDTLLARIDSIVGAGMRERGLMGGTLALVRDGRVTLRGYGVAEQESRRAVDPDSTLFGISSISKTFTAVAVLQLAQRGLLELDDPAGRHIEQPELDDYDDRPVRIAHLLVHTGGFDDATIGIAARTPQAIVPLDRYLAEQMPPQVRPPGVVTSYSNHGYALAGLIVQRASGMPFAQYMRTNVFQLLGMNRSGFEQPLPAPLEAARAQPYARDGDTWRVVPRIWFNDAPASAMYTTAGDMSRFIQRLLASTNDPVLAPMLQQQFTNHPAVHGITYGMRERDDRGVRAFEQGGDWQDYSSGLIVSPQLGTGVFVAFSGADGSAIVEAVWQAIVADAAPPLPRPEPARNPNATIAGLDAAYRANRYSRNTVSRLGILVGAIPELVVTRRDSALHLADTNLVPLGDDVFHRPDRGTVAAFRRDVDGAGSHLFLENSPYTGFERVRWYDATPLHAGLFISAIATMLVGLGLSAISIRRRWWTGSREWRAMAGAFGTLEVIALVVTFGLAFVLGTTDLWEFQYGMPASVGTLKALALLTPLLAIAGIAAMVLAFMKREGDAKRRGLYVIRAIAAVIIVALFMWWQVIG